MLKIALSLLLMFIMLQASDYTRANAAAKESLKGLDCEFDECPKEAPKPQIIIQEKVVYVEKPVVVEREVVVEKVVYKDRPEGEKITVQMSGTSSSCQDIKEKSPYAKSGYYDIFVENTKHNVYCEMKLAGGGWTRVWQADRENYQQTQFDYDLPYSFIEKAAYTMISFDNQERQLFAYNFKTPSEWKIQHPLSYSRGTARVDAFDSYTNKEYRNRALFYGFENFSSKCSEGFKGGEWGKICIANTKAPFYASFDHAENDFCNTSEESYNTVVCKEKRFTIFMK